MGAFFLKIPIIGMESEMESGLHVNVFFFCYSDTWSLTAKSLYLNFYLRSCKPAQKHGYDYNTVNIAYIHQTQSLTAQFAQKARRRKNNLSMMAV